MEDLHNPVIFISPGRSGSTIISEMILAHKELGGPSNYTEWFPNISGMAYLSRLSNNDYWYLEGVKGQLIKTLPFNNLIPRPAEAWSFWQTVTRSDIDFSRDFLLYKRAAETERKQVHQVLSKMLAKQGKARLGIKLTGPGRVEFLHSLFPDAHFINIVREPSATVNSLLNMPFWQQQGAKKLWWKGAYSDSELETYQSIRHDPIASTAFQLNKVLRTTREEIERLNLNALTVNYEDFIANPIYTTRQILSFCHLSNDSRIDRKLKHCHAINRNAQKLQNPEIKGIVEQWCPNS